MTKINTGIIVDGMICHSPTCGDFFFFIDVMQALAK